MKSCLLSHRPFAKLSHQYLITPILRLNSMFLDFCHVLSIFLSIFTELCCKHWRFTFCATSWWQDGGRSSLNENKRYLWPRVLWGGLSAKSTTLSSQWNVSRKRARRQSMSNRNEFYYKRLKNK